MSHYQPPFESLLESENDVAFLLDSDFRFCTCSPAWDTFALANGGRGISRQEIIGKKILDFTPDVLRRSYEYKYSQAQQSGSWVEFDYHCSSPEKIRLIRMSIRPVKDAMLVANFLRLEEECEPRTPLTTEERRRYFSASEILTMCAGCRKAKERDVQDTWTWVPEFLHETNLRVSHGLCPRCFSLFYGDV